MAPPLLEGFDPAMPYWLEQTAFQLRFRRSPLTRAKRHGMLRNVCVALGNWADLSAVEPLAQALADPVSLVRGHAAWALGQILRQHSYSPARDHLSVARASEADAWVAEEINAALQG